MTVIEINLSAAPTTVTVDFVTQTASSVEARSEAVLDVSRTADEVVKAYRGALGELADR